MKRLVGAAALAIVAVGTTVAQANDVDFENRITPSLSRVAPSNDEIDPNLRRGEDQAVLDAAAQCRAIIDEELKAGAPPTARRSVRRRHTAYDGDPQLELGPDRVTGTLAAFRAFCTRRGEQRAQLLSAFFAIRDVSMSIQEFRWKRGIDPQRLPFKLREGAAIHRACVSQVARALELKNPPTVRFDRPAVTLGDAAATICAPYGAELDKARATLLARPEYAGFATLAGDRKREVERGALAVEEVFGPVRTPLKTPADFAGTDTWYVVRSERDATGDVWVVRTLRFSGDKLTSSTEQRGPGKSPPDSAMP